MAVLRVEQLGKVYSGEFLWRNISFSLEQGEKVGLLGPNGCGKSTLIKALLGAIDYDEGYIYFSKNLRMATVSQHLETHQEKQSMRSYLLEMFADILLAKEAMDKQQEKMASLQHNPDALHDAIHSFTQARERYEQLGGYVMEAKIKEVIFGLGFVEEDLHRPLGTFSGGQKTRISLSRSLLREPDILILDEPNNYLDLDALAWLEGFLKNYKGSVLVVSHDRYFLDAVITRVLEFEQGHLYSYQGHYSQFMEKKQGIIENHNKLFAKQQEKIAQTEAYIQKYKAGIKSKQARGRQSQLGRLERMVKRGETQYLSLKVDQEVSSGKKALVLKNIVAGYDGKTLFSGVNLEVLRAERVGIIGANGCGKTTLLQVIREKIPYQGSVALGVHVKIGYFSQEHETLFDDLSVLDTLMEEGAKDFQEAREILAKVGFHHEEVDKKCKALSGGEKSRLVMAILLFQKPNVLLLDEPTNHLDVYARQALENALEDYPGTLIFVSHDRYFLRKMATRLVVLTPEGLQEFSEGLEQYLESKKTTPQQEESRDDENKKPSDKKLERVRKAKLGEIEREIMTLEEEVEVIHQSLVQEEVYADPLACARINEELEEKNRQLEQCFTVWEELMD